MAEIKPLTHLTPADLSRLVTGYTSAAKYKVTKTDTDQQFVLKLELITLTEPYIKRFEPMDEETLAHYHTLPAFGMSFGAFNGDLCVGIALAEPHLWNQSLSVWELHVAETHRGKGMGRRLMEAVEEKACQSGFRIIICETQNTNIPAIRFYRRMGFQVESVDFSLYSNEDYPDGEIALFMKKKITPGL